MELVLKTERLLLEPYAEADVDIAVELFADPDVRRYTGGAMAEDDIRSLMPKWTRRGGNGCLGVWGIKALDTREKLGSCALLPLPVDGDTDWDLVQPGLMPDAEIEIGYHLKPSVWGNGYATEACRRLVRFAFEESPLTAVVATHDKRNVGSRNVLVKSGFVDLGTRRCYGDDNAPFLRITREEWLARE